MKHAEKQIRNATLLVGLFLLPCTLFADWGELPPFPIGPTDGAVSFTIEDTSYFAGGIGNSRIVAWDRSSGWRVVGRFPDGRPRAWSFVMVHDGIAIIGGGDSTGGFTVTDEVFAFDPSTGEVTERNELAFGPRDGVWSFVIDGKGYLGGGFDGGFLIPDMWEYDFANDSWKQLAQPPLPPMIFASTFVLDGKGYVVGGGVNFTGTKTLYEFDPESGTWRTRAEFPGEARQAGVAFVWDGIGYFGLGMRSYDTAFGDIWRYDPMTDAWSIWRTDYPDFRSAWSTATVLGNEVLIGTGAGFNDGNLVFTRDFFTADLTASVSSVGEQMNYVERIDLE